MKKLIFVAVVVLIFLAVQARLFYQGGYQPPPSTLPWFDDVYVPQPPESGYSEDYQRKPGILVIDRSHDNDFSLVELNVPLMRIISRGFTVEYLGGIEDPETDFDFFFEFEPPPVVTSEPEEKGPGLKERLRYANALAIVLPREAFTEEEVKTLKEFVDTGGKLLLVADPTRPSQINSVSSEFGLIFEDDYLYNLGENDGNFRNVYLRRFRESQITKSLDAVALYTSGSISSLGGGIAFTGAGTLSTRIASQSNLSPLAMSSNGRVLAVSDLTFMAEPYSNILDNNQLISNMVGWLADSQRTVTLADFPYFFKENPRIAYANADLLKAGFRLKNMLLQRGKTPDLGEHGGTLASGTRDTVYLGLFEDAKNVVEILAGGGITITVTKEEETKEEEAGQEAEGLDAAANGDQPPPVPEGAEGKEATPAQAKSEPTEEATPTPAGDEAVEAEEEGEEGKEPPVSIVIPGVGRVFQEQGTAILYFYQWKDAHNLLILADTRKTMDTVLDQLESGAFRNWLVNQGLAVYHAPKPAETPGGF